MQTDPIADFLTRLRNAAAAKHQRVDVPVSKLKTEIARILKEEGYISTYKLVDENKTRKMLRVFLKYPPQRDHRPEARLAPGRSRVSRLGGNSSRGGRAGNQHHDDAERLNERPRSAQSQNRRRTSLRGLVNGISSRGK